MTRNSKNSGGVCITGLIYLIIIALVISNWHIIAVCICVLFFVWIISQALSKTPKEKNKNTCEKTFYCKENDDIKPYNNHSNIAIIESAKTKESPSEYDELLFKAAECVI